MENGAHSEAKDQSPFRFAPDILARLGEELNPHRDQSLIELAKNAYDADATLFQISLSGPQPLTLLTESTSGSIVVTDNGDGMTQEELQDRWLVLGHSGKDQRERTARLGRIPVGSKGLGRLAALRMGTRCTVITRPRSQPKNEYRIDVDWSRYENATLIEDVLHKIVKGHRNPKSDNGTEVYIHDLTTSLGRMDVKRLARALLLLADPFGEDPIGFKPVLNAPEFSDLEELVKHRYFHEAEYHLVAEIDKNGIAKASVQDWKGQPLFLAEHVEFAIGRQGEPYRCPRATFDLWTFLLSRESFVTRNVTLDEVRHWLAEFGGVHVYQHGIRIEPYGNSGNDWLEMNLRRVRSPEERPSTNNSIGKLNILDPDDQIVQKTDRSGIIENETFRELRDFATDALEWMAKRRMRRAEELRTRRKQVTKSRKRRTKRKLEKAIERLPETTKDEVKGAFEDYKKEQQREVRQLKKEVQLYRTLSTAGITAATFAHESEGNPIKVISHSVAAIERRTKEYAPKFFETKIKEPVQSIKHGAESLAVLGAATLKLVDHEKRRPILVDVHERIKEVLKLFSPFLAGRDVEVEPRCDAQAHSLRATEAAIESVITNLLNNSAAALEGVNGRARKIQISTRNEDDVLVLTVSDNGPGIDGISTKDIWLPGQTTRKNGTGLGLTIVRDTVIDLGGEVSAIEHGTLGGAEISIVLPVLGVGK